ncbi:MAG: helix-turn-helix transcriptional regulator [Chlamydiae bacterium]|nr:helix-turn-helix transcriptional regulator [Chlamydiota bacterium]MBI3276310.1 helix-turn-helix transcriptional regulator [Chlamydiota bacterium]
MKRRNWYWDIRVPYEKIKKVLLREDDPRFPAMAGVLLSRVRDPKEVFKLISPNAFCRRYRAIEKEILSDEWTKDKSLFWRAIFLRLVKELKEKGEKVRQPAIIKLDEFDRHLIEKVRQHRKNALMTQKELANFMGCTQQYISGIEKGREKISIEFLKKLAQVSREEINIVFGGN